MMVFGSETCGKSSLVRKLLNPKEVFSSRHVPTIVSEFIQFVRNVKDKPWNFKITDISGESKYERLLPMQLKNADLGMLCVDLSSPETIQKCINDFLDLVRASNANMEIILVGTRCDLASTETVDQFINSNQSLGKPVHALCVTSVREGIGLEQLLETIVQVVEKRNQHDSIIIQNSHQSYDPLSRAIERTATDCHYSLLQERLRTLQVAVNQLLDKTKADKIRREASNLVDALQNKNKDKMLAIQEFENNCETCLKGSHPNLVIALKAVAGVVVAATVLVLIAMVGFGIGFSLGLWSGPGAFFSGLAGGAGAIVVATSSVSSAVAGGVTLFSLFTTNSLEKAVQNEIKGVVECKHYEIVNSP
jgi:small GTP-binding protein